MQLISSLSRGGFGGDRAFRLLVEVVLVDAMVDIFCVVLIFVSLTLI